MGRKKLFAEHTLLALVKGTRAAVDSVRRTGETRADFYRLAIGQEVARRLGAKKPKAKP